MAKVPSETTGPIVSETRPPRVAGSEAKSTVLLSGKAKIIAVALIFLAGIGYLAVYAFNEATTQYLEVDEVTSTLGDAGQSASGGHVGIIGKLVAGSYVKSPDGITANFRVRDEGGAGELPVVYAGEIGEVFFNEHSELIMTGIVEADGVFHAEQMTVRCPSKYLTAEGDTPY